ncbi:MAG TPA: hypothetical protein VGS96_19720 [Thermoanaerobaculia bacterium]|jgi:hypothetical protein|nr:hypothetical protein [Thermoanaerobaculia bacterium]
MRLLEVTVKRLGLVVLIAAAIAAVPVLHTHPLTDSSPANSLCAVCATTTARITSVAPTVPAPVLADRTFVLVVPLAHDQEPQPPRASRAPPA